MFRTVTTLLMGATLVAGTATAGQAGRTNLDVFNDVSASVNRYAQFTIFDDVTASVDNGVVILNGSVTMPYKKNDIEKRVAQIDGVRRVDDRIEVLPTSLRDDEIRVRVARAIYGHPIFWRNGARANPSIHVIVNQGHLTLTGVVGTELDRTVARAMAGQFGVFSIVNNLKTEAEVQSDLEKL